MLFLYIILIGIIIAAAVGISERSWKEFSDCTFFFGILGTLLGLVLTILGSAIATDEAKSVPVIESVYTVYSLNEVFGDSYEDNDYILFKDNELYVYVKDNDSGLIVEKELADDVKICYFDVDVEASLTERELDYASPILRHLFWEKYLPESIIEIPEGSLITPYGDMFIKETK